MNEAVFSGSLVNLKNVATHKSVALTIEVPEEYAAALIAAFGWPTRVRPVPVAIARLAGEAVQEPPKEKKKEHWSEMAPSKQAAILCQEEDFKSFLMSRFSDLMLVCGNDPAAAVRAWCSVSSRSEIKPGNDSGTAWREIMIQYGAWLRKRRGD